MNWKQRKLATRTRRGQRRTRRLSRGLTECGNPMNTPQQRSPRAKKEHAGPVSFMRGLFNFNAYFS